MEHLPAATADGRARRAAYAAAAELEARPTTLVSYQSRGSVAVVGDEAAALPIAADVAAAGLSVTVVVPLDADAAQAPALSGPVRRVRLTGVSGHLGQFRLSMTEPGTDQSTQLPAPGPAGSSAFDLVLDLCESPWIDAPVPPPGYLHAASPEQRTSAMASLPELVGEFEKPRYFDYDAAICAHGRSGVTGCSRCVDACPTLAISALAESIEVDPYLCQGGGVCAAVCPTGAITYAYPTAQDLHEALRRALHAYAQAPGEAPVLLLVDADAGAAWVRAHGDQLPERVLPWIVEEVASTGPDTWLCAFAYGAAAVCLLTPPGLPGRVAAALAAQIAWTNALLEAAGLAPALSVLGHDAAQPAQLGAGDGCRLSRTAGFAAPADKRTAVRLAVDHLVSLRGSVPAPVALPAGAPFGELELDDASCTLCMACTSVCPASALQAGGDRPALRFIEWNCVQCGICERACPEAALQRSPRYVFDHNQRMGARTLKEEAPFACVTCGKPFATVAIIERMRDKLKGHWMFQDAAAMQRLEMCEDCRVKALFRDEARAFPPPERPG